MAFSSVGITVPHMRTLLLSQALYSGNLGAADVKDLQMLCSDVSSVLALGDARIRVHLHLHS